MDEKRKHRRQLMHGVAQIDSAPLAHWQPMILLDLSLKGLSFTHPSALPQGDQRKVRFSLPGNSFLYQLAIKVVHSSTLGVPYGYRIGAVFEGIDQESEKAIANFLAKSFT
jgi:hypothetical protein